MDADDRFARISDGQPDESADRPVPDSDGEPESRSEAESKADLEGGMSPAGAGIAQPAGVSDRLTEEQLVTVESTTTPLGLVRWWAERSGRAKLAVLMAVTLAVAAVGLTFAVRLPGPSAPVTIRWWFLAPMFYAAELAVVHLRFRRDAHSYSLSEIPLVLALFLAGPIDLVIGQAIGGFAALFYNRRQRGAKLWFNVVEFFAQAVVALAVFRFMIGFGDPLGWSGWVGAIAATTSAFVVADWLIVVAIRLTGGRLSPQEMRDVLVFGTGAAAMNTGLALLAVTILWLRPASLWLAVLPTVILFVAYRVYTEQREERSRVEALYQVTLSLHAAPMIEDALRAAVEKTSEMFEAETVEIVLFPEWEGPFVYVTSAGADRRGLVMEPRPFDTSVGLWPEVLKSSEGMIVSRPATDNLPLPAGDTETKQVMVVPLDVGKRRAGVMLAANPLSVVGDFHPRDLQVFETIASGVSVSLENGRLEDSLNEVTRLKERLEELVRSKDQFIASVSHELRTPLTGIVGLARELTDNRASFAPEELDEFVGHIYEQSAELGNIIEDLLVAARADIGTLVVRPVSTDLLQELAPVIATHSQRAGRSSLDPEVRGSAPEAMVDPLRFRQIIRNLITNAIRYGGEQIWVELESAANMVTVAVVDNGDGVPEETVAQIFEPYSRGGNARANPSSVGLGLAVSRQLARLMDGELIYRRRDGNTRFELALPLVSGVETAS